jgi:PAS domain S-box-containing protein
MGGYVVKYMLKKPIEKSFLYSENNIIVEVNKEFINLTGYSENELIGKSLTEISRMIRIDSQINLQDIKNDSIFYIFAKSFEEIQVTISCKTSDNSNIKRFFFKEKPCSIINEKFDFAQQLYTDRKTGVAIISVPDLILIKANQNYLDFLDEPYNKMENSIGKKQKEIVTGYEGSEGEELWINAINTGKPYYVEEFQYNYYKRGVTYWNSSIVPMFIEGKLKYIIQTTLDVSEKVLNRKAIKQKNEELETIIENMSDGLFFVDKDNKYIKLNSSTSQFIYNPAPTKTVDGTSSYTECCASEGNLLQIENFPVDRVLRGEKIKEYRLTCHGPHGILYFNVSGNPVYDNNGNIKMAILCSRNVTKRVYKDELIRTQKEKLETIIENMSDYLVIMDKDGNFITSNKNFRNYYLNNNEELKNLKDSFEQIESFDADGNLILQQSLPNKSLLMGEKFSGYKLNIKNNGNLINLELNGTPICDDKGNFIAEILIGHDITDRIKNVENQLIKTQLNLLNNIIENVELGLVRCSYPEFKIIVYNNKFYSHFKQINPRAEPLSSIKGKNFFDVFKVPGRGKKIRIIQDLIDKKGGVYFNIRKINISGEEKFLKYMYQPLFGLNNQIVEIIVIAIDITEEVKAKNNIKTLLKIQMEFFANVSHELKTPLNVIFSANQLMELYLKNNSLELNKEKLSKNISSIKKNCYRLTKIINNIVDSSKIEAGFFKLNLSNEDIVQITEDIVQSVADYIKGKGLSIVFDTNTEEKVIACDPDKIERIILNLISNAIKFSNPGGSIFVYILDKGDTVEIAIKDTGIGIEKKYLNNIFERFQQVDKSLSRNTEGSGIGLSLIKSIIEIQGGKISVESEVGKGSIFKVEIPVRTVKNLRVIGQANPIKNKIEMINVEFSDIYSL